MSKWFAAGAVIFLALVVAGAWLQGYAYRGEVEKIADAKADAEQLEEQREIQNAVNKLDDTGLRDTILLPKRKN